MPRNGSISTQLGKVTQCLAQLCPTLGRSRPNLARLRTSSCHQRRSHCKYLGTLIKQRGLSFQNRGRAETRIVGPVYAIVPQVRPMSRRLWPRLGRNRWSSVKLGPILCRHRHTRFGHRIRTNSDRTRPHAISVSPDRRICPRYSARLRPSSDMFPRNRPKLDEFDQHMTIRGGKEMITIGGIHWGSLQVESRCFFLHQRGSCVNMFLHVHAQAQRSAVDAQHRSSIVDHFLATSR